MTITKEQYISDPCGSLSTAYWKSVEHPVPPGISIIHERDFDGSGDTERYFRLFHDLSKIASSSKENYIFKNVDVETQKQVVAKFLSICYNTEYSVEFVSGLINTRVFDNELWIFMVEISSSQPVALGIADFDTEIKEGSLEWIQVLPNKRGAGFGAAIVNELLSRLRTKANFATVSGRVDNITKPERLYRNCDFTGNDIWHVIHT